MTLRGGDAAPPASPARCLAMLILLVSLLGAGGEAQAASTAPPSVSPAAFAKSARPAPLAHATQEPAAPAPASTSPADPSPAGQPATGAPVVLSGRGNVWRWSFVIRQVAARAEPRADAA